MDAAAVEKGCNLVQVISDMGKLSCKISQFCNVGNDVVMNVKFLGYDFTKEIYRQAGYKTEVLPVTTAEYGLSKAARPFNSRLDKSKLVEAGFAPLPTWQDALSRYLKEINQ